MRRGSGDGRGEIRGGKGSEREKGGKEEKDKEMEVEELVLLFPPALRDKLYSSFMGI